MTAADPVEAVTGVPRSAVLDRCAARRAGLPVSPFAPPPPAAPPRPPPVHVDPNGVRFADLRAAGDEDFVVSAHVAILGRPPYDPEFNRRLREVRGGKTRLEIIGRLALSRDGRGTKRPRVAGVVLPALLRAVRVADRAAGLLEGTRALDVLRAAVARVRRGRRR
ncbi:MAG: hypothetical protein AVDCRST_MAG04-783 [uncultured Acetobacteraceae bacterium]|uniref:Uncharacterized protein n=1 Tax=uncultured Acetobacteraceae bacterium TaxID=169975 RepID=A0A6J4HIQ6_9PROT|nr:MAG: hypothetical protein AVDCRST_MAG04-783 [uncultured Acetobacteraceae bacterium]